MLGALDVPAAGAAVVAAGAAGAAGCGAEGAAARSEVLALFGGLLLVKGAGWDAGAALRAEAAAGAAGGAGALGAVLLVERRGAAAVARWKGALGAGLLGPSRLLLLLLMPLLLGVADGSRDPNAVRAAGCLASAEALVAPAPVLLRDALRSLRTAGSAGLLLIETRGAFGLAGALAGGFWSLLFACNRALLAARAVGLEAADAAPGGRGPAATLVDKGPKRCLG